MGGGAWTYLTQWSETGGHRGGSFAQKLSKQAAPQGKNYECPQVTSLGQVYHDQEWRIQHTFIHFLVSIPEYRKTT